MPVLETLFAYCTTKRVQQFPPTFSAELVLEVFFPCIFFQLGFVKSKENEVNHNIAKFDLKQKYLIIKQKDNFTALMRELQSNCIAT